MKFETNSVMLYYINNVNVRLLGNLRIYANNLRSVSSCMCLKKKHRKLVENFKYSHVVSEKIQFNVKTYYVTKPTQFKGSNPTFKGILP